MGGVQHLTRHLQWCARWAIGSVAEHRKTEVLKRNSNLMQVAGFGSHLEERRALEDLQ